VWGLKEIRQKLDFISGDINRIFGKAGVILDLIREIGKDVKEILKLLKQTPPIPTPDLSAFYFSKFKLGNIIIEGRLEKLTMNEFQQVTGTFTALKKNGQPAKVQNASVVSDNPAACTAEISGENTVLCKSVEGGVQEATAVLITVTADADLGDGVREIQAVGSLTITPGEAETLALEFGEPEDKPTA
jgi:hypothetical protein